MKQGFKLICLGISVYGASFVRGGGGGGLKSLARISFSIACTKIKWIYPNITWIVLPENGYLKNSRGPAAPLAPWAVRLCALARRPTNNFSIQFHLLQQANIEESCTRFPVDLYTSRWNLFRYYDDDFRFYWKDLRARSIVIPLPGVKINEYHATIVFHINFSTVRRILYHITKLNNFIYLFDLYPE